MWSKVIEFVDDFLNQITMYRLVEYLLIFFIGFAVVLSFFKLLPFSPINLLLSTGFIMLISKISNEIFAKTFGAPTNTEAVYITGLILALIVSPAASLSDWGFLFWAAVLATASKYILNIGNKHIFNPAAIAVVLTSIGFGGSASWWVGNTYMAVPVVMGSFLIIRKIKRQDLVKGFLFVVILLSLELGIINGSNPTTTLTNMFFRSSLLFFVGVMLTEPLTSPTTKDLQFAFGTLVGFLFVPQVHLGNIYFTPEQALVVGNIFAYMASPKGKLVLRLKEKIKLTADTFEFVFTPSRKISYVPGQYMEWTLSHNNTDDRGNRRYFTLASSPTERDLRIGVKFYPKSSSFKKSLVNLGNTPIVASQLAGDFVLPKNTAEKSVFMAGGIGITPFRSMIKYLTDTNQTRDIVLLYAANNEEELVYRDIFDQADKTGVKVIYRRTDSEGRFDRNNLPQLVPDFEQRHFYISGPHQMVTGSVGVLKSLGIKEKMIKTDYFPGFA